MTAEAFTNLEEISPLYAGLMEEVKRRVDVIISVLNRVHPLPLIVAVELCYLQLRKIVEMIALACLAAHGDILDTKANFLQKAYNADHITNQLGKLHPDFFPIPGEQRLDPLTQRPVEVVRLTSGFLSKDDLLNLYGKCGDYLHRGSLRQIIMNRELNFDFEKIALWTDQIIKLLNHHQIQTSHPDTMLWVLMNDKEDGQVKCFPMRRINL